MGGADSTANVVNSGLRIFNSYQKKNFEAFVEDMTADYVEEDNIKVLLTDYSNWLSTTDIPKYFDEYLKINSILNLNARKLNNDLINIILMSK